MELGNNIRNIRKQRGLRQEQLAEAMGVSIASVSKWENGQCAPELTVLMELADFFEVSMDTLVGHSLNADRLEALISQMEEAAERHDEETAAALCEKILRNYPNNSRAVKACSDTYYELYIYTTTRAYMEQCIAQTKRLMTLKEGEPERERLIRIHYLGNQYSHLMQWDTAREYYEQSNVMGSSDADIAECLLKQGQTDKAIDMVSDILLQNVLKVYGAVNTLADGWIELGESRKAIAALEWVRDTMAALRYTPTVLILNQVRLAGLYHDLGDLDAARSEIRKAAELVRENDRQEFTAAVDFLRIGESKKMLTNAPGSNRELLRFSVEKMDCAYMEVVKEVLQ